MANITITIQAASDAVMTDMNYYGGDANNNLLADDDPRKMYGLPNMVMQGGKLFFKNAPRWDTVTLETQITSQAAAPAYKLDDKTNFVKPNPTTTAFQLNCDSVRHEFQDLTAISPIPAFDVRDGAYDSTGTPGQLNNIIIALGMRTEVIQLSGTLVDRGMVSATNPRRQTLLNIARTQYLKISRGGKKYGQEDDLNRSNAGWGGEFANPMNPRSYPCLNLFYDADVLKGTNDDGITPGYSLGREPSGDSRQYRGIIKDLSFRLEGGRPDIWTWNMKFAVVNNEHSGLNISRPEWNMGITRIRQVTEREGEDNDAAAGYGYVEVRFDVSPRIYTPNLVVPNGDQVITRELAHADQLLIN